MASLSKSIKNSILTPERKSKDDQRKIATIIAADDANNSYTISLITREGIPVTRSNVPYRKKASLTGFFDWKPEEGDKVYVEEINTNYVIVEKHAIEYAAPTTTYDTYSDTMSSSSINIGGSLG